MRGQELVRRYKAGQRSFSRVRLRSAQLEGADVTNAQLALAASLKYAVLPDGSKHV